MLFLKLGGSLITDKTGVEAIRPGVLARLAGEIAGARATRPDLSLLVGHGGGSFGHVVADKYGTRQGVMTADQWIGFAQVHAAMVRLNRLVTEALLAEGVPAVSFQPSALAACADGRITTIIATPIQSALDAGLVPVIYGDVAFDSMRGGTIISTEEIMMALAGACRPSWLLLAGETDGVLDLDGKTIPLISRRSMTAVAAALGGSRGTDVTGGMAAKVQDMVNLVEDYPELLVRIFSGLIEGELNRVLLKPQSATGTVIRRE